LRVFIQFNILQTRPSFLKKEGCKNIAGIYTYGAPRVGNDDYRNYINRVFNNKYWRFMHDHDIVPDLPPSSRFGGYSREGCMLRLKQRNNKSEYELLRIVNEQGDRKRYGNRYDGYSASDHSMTEYINRLSELIEQQPQLIEQQNPERPETEVKFSKELLKEGKILGEEPEVFALKRDILVFGRELQNPGFAISLEEVAKRFNIHDNLLNIFQDTSNNVQNLFDDEDQPDEDQPDEDQP
jgi:hypothetical protein